MVLGHVRWATFNEGILMPKFESACVALGLLLCLGLCVSARSGRAAKLYHVTDLGDTGDGASDQDPHGINASGEVTGGSRASSAGGVERGYIWTPTAPNATTGTIQHLNVPTVNFPI